MTTATDLLLIRAGVTYRQVDHWVRKGWVEPRFRHRDGERVDNDGLGKQGFVRDFTPEEERVIIRMGRLTNAGIRAEVAATAARSMVDRDEDWARLGFGVVVTLEEGTNESAVVTSS